MRYNNASPLLHTYSYGKFGLEVSEVFWNAFLAQNATALHVEHQKTPSYNESGICSTGLNHIPN